MVGAGLQVAGAGMAQAAVMDFSSSFEAGDAQPLVSTVDVDGSGDRQHNLTGARIGLPGSLLGHVTAVTASAENPPNEVAARAADDDSNTKWLARTPTPWLQYGLDAPAAVTVYTLTSANDAGTRDPAAWQILGSHDGATWTTLDTQTGQSFPSRYLTKQYSFANTEAFEFYRLNITANNGDTLFQLADWNISDGSATLPPSVPMVTQVGTGPASGPNIKAGVGFTGTASLRYSGTIIADGAADAHNVLYATDIAVGPTTQLSYKIFPELTAGNLQYPSTFAAIDLHFTDGSHLADLGAVDHSGIAASAAGQGEGKILYANQWNSVRIDLGAYAGKTVDRILLSYDNPAGGERSAFQGWIDDLALTAAPDVIAGTSRTEYVDTRRGTNSSGSFSRGNNIPAAAVPNGFNFLVPMTNATSQSWEYSYAASNNSANLPTIQGFGISHEPSPWMGDRNQFSVMPATASGTPNAAVSTRAMAFSHDDEIAQPDYYGVTFTNGLRGEMTPTDHGGIMRFTYPGATGQVMLDTVAGSGAFTFNADGTVTGWVDNGSGLSAGRTRMFVAGTFSKTPTSVGTPSGSRPNARFASFDTSSDHVVELRFATSFISVAQAQHNLGLELTGQSFDQTRDAAQGAWDDRLGVVDISGANQEQKVSFYSNLYRLNLYPNSQFENTGSATDPVYKYASPVSDTTGAATATDTNAKIVDGKIYVNNGFWDTYRTVWSAYSLLYPDVAAELVDGFVQQARDGGWVARWSSPGYADLMTGTSSDVAFADAYLKGVDVVDPLGTYQAGLKNATTLPTSSAVGRKGFDTSPYLGYTTNATGESVSWALEGYINDYGLGNMAAALAKDPSTPADQVQRLTEESEYLLDRALHYTSLFDPSIGFFQSRKADGSFVEPADTFDPEAWGGAYTETNAWNFAFHAPQDGEGLASLYGGRAALEAKLDEFFSTPETASKPGGYGNIIHEMLEARDVRMGQFGMSNQPSHHIPFMYNYTGAPYKTQALTREVLQRLFVGSDIGQGYPGDEDNGETSAWYLLASLGLYPLQVGSSDFTITSPQFSSAVVHLAGGSDLTINAQNNSTENVYIQSLKVNGRPYSSTSIDASMLVSGGVLDFRMGSAPSTWGSAEADAPPSLTEAGEQPTPMEDATGPGMGTSSSPSGAATGTLFDNTSRTQAVFDGSEFAVDWSFASGSRSALFYTVTSAAGVDTAPSAWTLEGSTDGKTWSVLDTRNGEVFANAYELRPFKVATPGDYAFYRLAVTGNAGATTTAMAELELLVDPNAPSSGSLNLSALGDLEARTGIELSTNVATFAAGDGTTAADYTATIDWGDGTAPSTGTITSGRLGTYVVSGAHTYADPGVYEAVVSASDGVSTASDGFQVEVSLVAPGSLAAAYDSVCIGDIGVGADCDSKTWSYPRDGLAAAGFVQGTRMTVPGTDLTFWLPQVPTGAPDNATGAGQTIVTDLPDDATKLSFIGVGTQANQNTLATVTFTDDSTEQIPLQFTDWTIGGNSAGTPAYGNIKVAMSDYRLYGTGQDGAKPFIFATVPYDIPAGKTVASITLPLQTGDPRSDGRIHLFAIADNGTPVSPLDMTAAADVTGEVGVPVDIDLATLSGGHLRDAASVYAHVTWGDGTPIDDVTIAAGPDANSYVLHGVHTFASAGTYTVKVSGADGAESRLTRLTVTINEPQVVYTPTMEVTPSGAVDPGTTLSLSGSGFAPGESVTLTLSTVPETVVTATASGDGSITAQLTVPAGTAAGLYSLVALGVESAVPVTATVEVQEVVPEPTYSPAVSLSKSSASVGETVTVTGDGFAPNDAVTMTLHSTPIPLGTATADAHGILSATFTVPSADLGSHTVVVAGAVSGEAPGVAFQVVSADSPDPTDPPTTPGTTTGSGGQTGVAFQPPGGTLSGTGSGPVALWVITAVALTALGVALVVVRRRRRS